MPSNLRSTGLRKAAVWVLVAAVCSGCGRRAVEHRAIEEVTVTETESLGQGPDGSPSLAGPKPLPQGSGFADPPTKKLIQFGWGLPTSAAFLKENIREMEKEPFDGLAFYISYRNESGGKSTAQNRIFVPERLKREWFRQEFEDLRQVEFRKFTDNFITIWTTPGSVDWFNDEHWDTVCHNVGLIAEAARLCGARGIMLDCETYSSKSMWNYLHSSHSETKSYEQYAARARLRGAQVIRAIQSKLPRAVVLTLFQMSYFSNVVDQADTVRAVTGHGYGLIPPFLNGMLDAADPDVKIVDGNETSYAARTPEDFLRAYHLMRQRALRLIAPENRAKYNNQVLAGHGLFMDSIYGLYRPSEAVKAMSLAEKNKVFEECVYWSLRTCDEYVWCYSERPRWWKNPTRNVPQGAGEAIRSARKRLAYRKAETLALGEIKPDRIEVPRLAGQAPVIDGDLGDPAWKAARHVPGFLLLETGLRPLAQTQAWVTYDMEKLYVSLLCAEPHMDKLSIRGTDRRDSNIWAGDCVELFLSPGAQSQPFYHLILNPVNVQWDSFTWDQAFNPKWQSAVRKNADRWTVELAVPWKQLRMTAPEPGEVRRGNLCRVRRPDKSELSSWSQLGKGFQEPRHFGYWLFE